MYGFQFFATKVIRHCHKGPELDQATAIHDKGDLQLGVVDLCDEVGMHMNVIGDGGC